MKDANISPDDKNRSGGMTSIKSIYKTGRGPSSSHTIGPERACRIFLQRHPEADAFKVFLYGSLACTGKGHGADEVIKKTFAPLSVEIIFDTQKSDLPHPNTMDLYAYKAGKVCGSARVVSIGGGNISFGPDISAPDEPIVYPERSFDAISKTCKKRGIRLWQFVYEREGNSIEPFLLKAWTAMKNSIARGLNDSGILPGGLNVHKRAKTLYDGIIASEHDNTDARLICAYAFAVSEQNAMGETIVTAPTCGSAGVVPAVLFHHQQKHGCPDTDICRALATAGIIGDLIKTNASISGAECGCQAEIGSACAMAAAALCELRGMNIDQIGYSAEVSIEHHLGLTCDPIAGLVQIPCIERNAVAAMRAVNAADLADFLWDSRKISPDRVIRTMKETGQDLNSVYRETSLGGLAKLDI